MKNEVKETYLMTEINPFATEVSATWAVSIEKQTQYAMSAFDEIWHIIFAVLLFGAFMRKYLALIEFLMVTTVVFAALVVENNEQKEELRNYCINHDGFKYLLNMIQPYLNTMPSPYASSSILTTNETHMAVPMAVPLTNLNSISGLKDSNNEYVEFEVEESNTVHVSNSMGYVNTTDATLIQRNPVMLEHAEILHNSVDKEGNQSSDHIDTFLSDLDEEYECNSHKFSECSTRSTESDSIDIYEKLYLDDDVDHKLKLDQLEEFLDNSSIHSLSLKNESKRSLIEEPAHDHESTVTSSTLLYDEDEFCGRTSEVVMQLLQESEKMCREVYEQDNQLEALQTVSNGILIHRGSKTQSLKKKKNNVQFNIIPEIFEASHQLTEEEHCSLYYSFDEIDDLVDEIDEHHFLVSI